MKKILVVFALSILINIDIGWTQNNGNISESVEYSEDTLEEIKLEFNDVEDVSSISDSSQKTIIEFTEEEALKLKGKIPKPQALVILPKKKIRPAGKTFAPDIEKLLDELLKIKR
ncbi:MAG: hypothetical protein H8D22_11770 [Candidatus Cloacimonetes bacterium]|nr:hypothetical protein [Candidatus Cloacimonadota bacterium]